MMGCEMLNVPERITENKVKRKIIHRDGREDIRELYWFDDSKVSDVSVNFPKFEEPFRYYDCIIDGRVGNAHAQLCSAVRMKNVVELIYKNNSFKELLNDSAPIEKKLYEKGEE